MDTIFAFICINLAFIAGFGASFLYNWHVKRSVLSITRANAGEKGRNAKIEQEGELATLITEATILLKEGKAKGEKLQETAVRIAPMLVAKYPTVVMKHGKKLLKMITDGGGMEAFEDMFS